MKSQFVVSRWKGGEELPCQGLTDIKVILLLTLLRGLNIVCSLMLKDKAEKSDSSH